MTTPRMATFAIILLGMLGKPALADVGPFARFDLPDAWEARFWGDPAVSKLLDLDAKAIAALVPEQAGIKHCRCPVCGAGEAADPLSWSLAKPEVLTCRECGAVVPNDTIPAKVDGKVPEDTVEVAPRRFHRYPYHAMDPEKAAYADERLYLAAKRDFEAREFLAKAAMYASVKYHEQPEGGKDPRLAKLASALLVRFARVYPLHATHYDQPGRPKFFDRADLPPPYRRGYGTAKWDWSGCLDVPLNLAIAFALVRDDPALAEAGRALGEPHPEKTIEHDLFRSSARFAANQPDEGTEMAVFSYRGMLAVGRLLDDPALVHEAVARLDRFLAKGFYHDGLWRLGDSASHARVMRQMDGWIDRLLAGYSDPEAFVPPDGSRPFRDLAGAPSLPMVALAREASRASWDARDGESANNVKLASWPAPPPREDTRRPSLLGGAGIARLGVGEGENALDLELRGLGDYGGMPSGRLAVRLAVGGRPVLGDLDDEGSPTAWGFERSTASRDTVMVDGLNQRETIDDLRAPAPGADIAFFAADPDFQVACLEDRFAYPRSASLYRLTIVAASTARTRYAVSIFEVVGGLQHDQITHASGASSAASWSLSEPTSRGPETLLAPGMPFLEAARPDDGRWFVQAMGAFQDLSNAKIDKPAVAALAPRDGPGVRLHLLDDFAATAFVGRSPGGSAEGRASLVLRRRSDDGAALNSRFVTVFDPLGVSAPLIRVGRIDAGSDVVALAIETAEGPEFLIFNPSAGKPREALLPDGRVVRTDGLVVRVTASGPILAGGTFAEVGAQKVTAERIAGTILAADRANRPDARGQFRVAETIPNPETLTNRALLIRHADGTSRGWTIAGVENLREGGARFFVREEAGLKIDPASETARHERFPGTLVPGPHRYRVSRIAR